MKKIILNYLAQINWYNETSQFIGIVPELPGAHSQAPTLAELYRNMEGVIQLCLQELTSEEKI